MKKIIIIPVVLLVAAFIGMPYIVGKVAEKASYEIVAKTNQDSDIYGTTEITEYQRSFRSTKSSFSYSPPDSFTELGWVYGDIKYQCDGSHGVLSYSYSCNLLQVGQYVEFINEHLNGIDPFSIEGQISVFGKITQLIKVDSFSIEEDDGKLEFKGASIESITDGKLRDYILDGEFKGLVFSNDETQGIIEKSTLSGDIYITDDKLQFGDIKIDLNKIDLKSEQGNKHLIFKNVLVTTSSKEKGENVDVNLQFDANKLSITENQVSHDIDNFELGLELTGLDRNAVVELNEISKELSTNTELTPEQSLQFLPVVEKLLKKGLILSFDIKTDYQGETAYGDLNVNFIDNMTLAESSALMFNPESILDKLIVKSTTKIPNSIIVTKPELKFLLEESPLYKAAGSGFESSIVLEKDNVSLNGDSIDFMELLGTVMQSMPR